MLISLVIPTLGRTSELDKLLDSIFKSGYKNVEIIIVDQNPSHFLDTIISKYNSVLNISHFVVSFHSASMARNYGLNLARGDIVSFPDDDSFIDTNTLLYVDNFFKKNPNLDLISGIVGNDSSLNAFSGMIRKQRKAKKITPYNYRKTTIEFNFYAKRIVLIEVGGFDARLGVGAFFGSEESGDLILRLLSLKKKLFFCNVTFCYHPANKIFPNQKKAFSYGLGYGALTAKCLIEKRYGVLQSLSFFYHYMRTLCFAIILYLCHKKERSIISMDLNKGRLKGYLEWRKMYD